MAQSPHAIDTDSNTPVSDALLASGRMRELSARVGILVVAVGVAGVLAVSALPARPRMDTVTSLPGASLTGNAGRSNVQNDENRVHDVRREATPTGPVLGPPERIRTATEQAVERLLATGGEKTDIAAVRIALSEIDTGRIDVALKRTTGMTSSGARKLVRWYAYRRFNSGVPAGIIEAFRVEDGNWPDGKLLRRRAEQALFFRNARAGVIREFFKTSKPRFPSGHAALAVAELEAGNSDLAREHVRTAWRDGQFGTNVETRLLARFKSIISQKDIKWRLDRYLLDDSRYGRPQRLAVIRRMIKLLKPDEAVKANARLLVWRSYSRRHLLGAAKKAFAALDRKLAADKIPLPVRKPDNQAVTSTDDAVKTVESTSGALKPASATVSPDKAATPMPVSPRLVSAKKRATDWPLEYQRIQLLRRQGRHGEAWRRLVQVPTTRDLIVSPEGWWLERRINAFNALYKKSYRMAYRLIANPGPLEPNERNEALFMSGWIALRFLSDPEGARRHFEAFTQSADGPRTRGQSHYWLARTQAILGNAAGAKENYRIAAREFNTFYGQLARQKLDPAVQSLDIPKPQPLHEDDIAKGEKADVIQALRFAKLAGHRTASRRLLRAIRSSRQPQYIFHLAAEFATATGDTQMGVQIGKSAMFHGVPLTRYAYPTHAFPSFRPVTPPPEFAMLYGLARQESEFNSLTTSIAGARGVLQVMQVAARDICRSYKLACGSRRSLRRRLNADPSYNARLASAYVSDRLEEFNGSYILTFAGYNAGPGRVRYWIGKNGDPRRRDVDPIDWIELIHLKETRDYVKKVMANLQIYRALLDTPDTALQITSDIERGAF